VFSLSRNPESWHTAAAIFGPIVLGYSTYKLIIWYSKPHTQPSLPAGGFEVITNVSPVAHRTELT
jgi:hypothetical protein